MSTARVDFTRGAAERIARAVRVVEQGERDQSGPKFGRVAESVGGGSAIKICTFTGSWGTGVSKTVTLKYQTATPNEYTAVNLFANISVDCGERNCAIAKSGTAWFLIQAQC